MATAEQIKALIRSHMDGDDGRFYAVALQVAAQAARHGHGRLADELKTIVDSAKENSGAPKKLVNIFQNKADVAGLFTVTHSEARFSSLIIPEEVKTRLERVILEHRQKAKLDEFGLAPRKKILIYGPPGTGKTLTASVLAGELRLPLFTIQFDSLITKFMGETAAKLRLVFDTIKTTKGVYFFDEFDAIGGNRSATNDVGEIRRVLNSFLQLLEQSDSDSIIIAATNHFQLLDKALFRRFDDVIEYQLPDKKQVRLVLERKLSPIGIKKLDWEKIVKKCEGLSYADIGKACEDTLKNIILQNKPSELTTEILLDHIQERLISKS